jgi:adenine-specific DNA-methyltransferase
LGNYADTAEERFCLNWAGKANARREAQKRSTGTLRPCPEESVDWDTTENLYIEGDNLEVLKLLQKSYHSRVKMIYIDPPYNTGKDFVYKDNYTDNMKNYLELTGQDRKLSTNTESDGRYHSNWLNMMYPRLKLARNLLTDDGVIFISIDDNEVANLIKISDEIFGEENFIDIFNWAKTETPENLSKKSKQIIEYIVCYQKTKTDQKFKGLRKESISSNGLLNQPNPASILIFPKDVVRTSIPDGIIEPGMYGTDSYDIELLEQTEVLNNIFIKPVVLKAKFKWSQQYLDNEIHNGTTIKIPTIKLSPSYEKLEYEPEVPANLINSKVGVDTNENAGNYQLKLFKKKVFNFPKPTSLIKYLASFNDDRDKEFIVLDFFSGSATTAEAVMQINQSENSNRIKFIMVQLPEDLKVTLANAYSSSQKEIIINAIDFLEENNRDSNLCEIAKERIRRAGKKILEEQKAKAEKEGGLFTEESAKLDVGFKVFKLDSSNINAWDTNPDNLETSLPNSLFHIKTDRSEDDLLYEILIKYGIELAEKINTRTIAGKTVYEMGAGSLIVCLADNLTTEVAEGIGKLYKEVSPDGVDGNCRVVFKDSGFKGSDEVKTNTMLILKQYGILNIASV